MKVDPTNIHGPEGLAGGNKAAETARVQTDRRPQGPASGPGDGAPDQVHLSNLLERLRQTDSATEQDITPERAARIQQLTAQVADGSYEVDSAKLASKIVDDTLKGLG